MIRSTFSGFTTTQLGLQASQRALDVVGQNITNVNTKGYTRQRLDLASISATGASNVNMQNGAKVGQGVEMKNVIQIRDPYLDIQYRTHLALVGTVDAQDTFLDKMGGIFDETDKVALRNNLNEIVAALNNLATPDNAGEGSSDSIVRSQMQIFVNSLHQKAMDMEQVRNDFNVKLKDTDIENINTYLKSIAKLNESIKNSQILGSPALELIDERNRVIDDLATYMPIEVRYEEVSYGSGIVLDEMHIDLKISKDEKYSLIDGANDPAIFRSTILDKKVNGRDGVLIEFTDTKGDVIKGMEEKLPDGVLKGLCDVLNDKGNFDDSDFRGLAYYEEVFNGFVNTFAQNFNEMNIPPQLDADGKVMLDANGKPILADVQILKGTDGKPIIKQATDKDGKTFNCYTVLTYDSDGKGTMKPVPANYVLDGTPDQNTGVVAIKKDANGKPEIDPDVDMNKLTNPLFVTTDGSDKFTASNIQVNTRWLNGEFTLTKSKTPDATGKIASTDYTNILHMIDSMNKPQSFAGTYENANGTTTDRTYFKGSYFEAYDNIQNIQAVDRQSSSQILSNRVAVMNQIANSKDAVSAVSTDEEVVTMMRFQQSYNAAAKVMTAMDELLTTLIERTGAR